MIQAHSLIQSLSSAYFALKAALRSDSFLRLPRPPMSHSNHTTAAGNDCSTRGCSSNSGRKIKQTNSDIPRGPLLPSLLRMHGHVTSVRLLPKSPTFASWVFLKGSLFIGLAYPQVHLQRPSLISTPTARSIHRTSARRAAAIGRRVPLDVRKISRPHKQVTSYW